MASLNSNIIVTNQLEKKLVKSLKEIEEEIWTAIQKLLRRFDTSNGVFVPNDETAKLLNTINKSIRDILRSAAIKDEVSDFIDDFDQLDQNIKAIQKSVNGIKVDNNIFTAQRKFTIDSTINSLLEANINLKFIDPVKKILHNRVSFGSNVNDAERQLRRLVIGTDRNAGVLQKSIGQVARDAIMEYQGTINQQIKVQYELNAVKYIGSLVEDSRAQCVRWVGKPGGIILDSELASEIEWAYRNGSGMIPETDTTNFCQRRGGYNCRHEAIPVRQK